MVQATADTVSSAIPKAASHTEFARAKINLALHVLERRDDGYHLLDSLVVFAEAGDTLTAFPDNEGFVDLDLGGLFAGGLDPTTTPDTNLVLAAAKALCEAYPGRPTAGLKLHLDKQLPVAAGLGGGSADAAAALRLLDRLWHMGLSDGELARLGLSLGADVPVCLASRPSFMRGVGEDVTPAPGIPPLTVLLVNPGASVSTPAVFGRLDPVKRSPLPPLPDFGGSLMEFIFWLRKTRNDLFEPAVAEAPAIEKAVRILAADTDCLFARMSGSGATVFGIFMSPEAGRRAAERIRAARPQWWVAVTRTGGS